MKTITAVARSTEAAFLQSVEKWLVYLPMKKDEVASDAQARSSKTQFVSKLQTDSTVHVRRIKQQRTVPRSLGL